MNNEFNALAALIIESAEDTAKDNFKLNLQFANKPQQDAQPQPADNPNLIEIKNFDFTEIQAQQKAKVQNIAKDFGDIDINNEELEGDDLLDLMDS